MLVLTRKQGQSFLVGENVEITLMEVSGDKVRIAIDAPRDVSILRKELVQTRETNRESLNNIPHTLSDLNGLAALKSALHSQGVPARQNPNQQEHLSGVNIFSELSSQAKKVSFPDMKTETDTQETKER